MIDDILIDTGISSIRIRKIKKNFAIKRVLISHWHEDHITGNRLLSGLEFACHPKDRDILENIQKLFDYYAIQGTSFEPQFHEFIESLSLENTPITFTFHEGDIISSQTHEIHVIDTPGHTPGHCCFYEPKNKIAFLADIDLSSFGPWYGGIDSNLIDFENSIKKMMQLTIDYAITSHKGIYTEKSLVKEKLKAYYDIIAQRDMNILGTLNKDTPKSAQELAGKNLIYPKYNQFEAYLILAEKIMIEKHFDKFLQQNLIRMQGNGAILI